MDTNDILDILHNISIIKELAEKFKHGVIAFSDYNDDMCYNGIIYDDVKYPTVEQPVFDEENDVSRNGYAIVYSCIAKNDIREVFSTYDGICDLSFMLWITTKKDGSKKYYISAYNPYDPNPKHEVFIENGDWYCN